MHQEYVFSNLLIVGEYDYSLSDLFEYIFDANQCVSLPINIKWSTFWMLATLYVHSSQY